MSTTFFETLELAVLEGNRAARKLLAEGHKASRMCFEDYVRSHCGEQVEPQPEPQEKNEHGVRLPEYKRRIVRNIGSQETIEKALNIILDSDWNFIDPRRRMTSKPEEVKEFLEELVQGRSMPMNDLHPKPRGLLATIVDSWLAWTNAGGAA